MPHHPLLLEMKLNFFHINTLLSLLFALVITISSCDDNDSFSTSPNNILTISNEALSLDTVFSKVPSASKKVMVYNRSGDGIRIQSIQQLKGADKTGFRVNVNGVNITPEENNTISMPMELRNGDSLRVWVELTSLKENGTVKPQPLTDDICFNLESGRQQKINLKAWTWDADTLNNHVLTKDSVIDNKGERPLVIHGSLIVNPDVTLTVNAGSIIYFHQDGGMNVKGRLVVNGNSGKDEKVIFRCDRLDSLLQLSYDEIPGKWQGITLEKSSENNEINYLDLHGSGYGIYCDSSDYKTIDDMPQKLTMKHSTIMNVLGDALGCFESKVNIENCLLANASGHCLSVTGGNVDVKSTTLASFYGYTASRKYALRMSDYLDTDKPLPFRMRVDNSIITGYAEDQVYWFPLKKENDPDILLQHSYLRTPGPTDEYSKKMLQNDIYDANVTEEYRGKGLFVAVNEDGTSFYYDFTPRVDAPVIGVADATTSCKDDILGKPRKETPDMGCYETFYEEKKEE